MNDFLDCLDALDGRRSTDRDLDRGGTRALGCLLVSRRYGRGVPLLKCLLLDPDGVVVGGKALDHGHAL